MTATDIAHDLDAAAKALSAYYDAETRYAGDGSTPQQQDAAMKRWRRDEQDAKDAIHKALKGGASLRQLSARSHMPGHLIIALIEDDQVRADAYAAEIYHLKRSLETVRQARIEDARAQYAAGAAMPKNEREKAGLHKTGIAAAFGITRVTLNGWLALAENGVLDTTTQEASR